MPSLASKVMMPRSTIVEVNNVSLTTTSKAPATSMNKAATDLSFGRDFFDGLGWSCGMIGGVTLEDSNHSFTTCAQTSVPKPERPPHCKLRAFASMYGEA